MEPAFRPQNVIARGATANERQNDARIASGAVQAFFQGRTGTLGPEDMAVGVRGILRRAAGAKAAFVVVNRADRTVSINKDAGTTWAAVTVVFTLYQSGPLLDPATDEQIRPGPWRCVAFAPGSGRGVWIAVDYQGFAAHGTGSEDVGEMREVMDYVSDVTVPLWSRVEPTPVVFETTTIGFQPPWAAGGILLVLLGEAAVRGTTADGIRKLWDDEARHWEPKEWRSRGQAIMYANCD